jgi:hypothetical protein
MKIARRLPLILVVCSVVSVDQAWAKVTCHNINTKGDGQIDFVANSSNGRFIGGGLLHGTTHGEFAFTSFDSTTGVGTYDGTFTITTNHGVLILHVFDGVFDQGTGAFRNDSRAMLGTGRFHDFSGGLFFEGVVAPDGNYTDKITGEVCFDLAADNDLLRPE